MRRGENVKKATNPLTTVPEAAGSEGGGPTPQESAKAAGLRYVSDAKPGIGRKKTAKGFRYVAVDGKPVKDAETLGRIKSLVIPPAWTEVWISPVANGHLQATGRDAKGRKQSRYHPKWRETRDETKYERMMHFGAALPCIRERVEKDLSRPGLPREKVLAALVRLMETTFIRVGNEEYARTNGSYGLTTMKNRHVEVKGGSVTFKFKGKSGVHHEIGLHDRRLAAIVKRCQDLPGHELFEYLDEEGQAQTVDSADVNDYLQEMTQQHFTAKDFRTWAGTVLAAMMLREFEPFETAGQAKKNVVAAIQQVAERLGNTPSVCRKCYVHPAVLECYLSGEMIKTIEQRVEEEERDSHELRQEEMALLGLLRERLAV
jgi:DNA topoisomerase-1